MGDRRGGKSGGQGPRPPNVTEMKTPGGFGEERSHKFEKRGTNGEKGKKRRWRAQGTRRRSNGQRLRRGGKDLSGSKGAAGKRANYSMRDKRPTNNLKIKDKENRWV